MREFTHTIKNEYDLSAKPAMDLIKLAGRHNCRTYVANKNYVTDIKQLFVLMSSGVNIGDTIRFITDGTDENRAIDRIGHYVRSHMN